MATLADHVKKYAAPEDDGASTPTEVKELRAKRSRRSSVERLKAAQNPTLDDIVGDDDDELEEKVVMFNYGAYLSGLLTSPSCCLPLRRAAYDRKVRRLDARRSQTTTDSDDDGAERAADEAERRRKALAPFRERQDLEVLAAGMTHRRTNARGQLTDDDGRVLRVMYTFNPDSLAKSAWDWVIVIFVIYNVMGVPMDLAFSPLVMSHPTFLLFDGFVDVCFAIDILMRFNTAMMGRWGKLVHDRSVIAMDYLQGMLIIDILAVFPFTQILSAGADVGTDGAVTGTALGMFKLFRLLRLGRLMKKLDQLAAANAFRVVKLLIGFVLLAHIIGCLWYLLGKQLLACVESPSCDSELQPEDLWIQTYVLDAGNSTVHRYTMSLFFTLTTMTTVGYGDSSPLNDIERQFCTGLLIIAAVAYAVVFGLMAAQIQEFDKTQVRYQSKITSIAEFLRLNKLPVELQHKTHEYIDKLWALNRGIDHHAVLRELPPTLQGDIMMTLHRSLVERVPLFKRALTKGGEAFIKAVVMLLKPQVALAGDMVVEEGSEATTMFFLHMGLVKFLRKKDARKSDAVIMGRGAFFGEEVLLSSSAVQRRTKSVQALELCHLYVLRIEDFRTVISSFPEYLTLLMEFATRRLEVAAVRVRLKEVAARQRRRREQLEAESKAGVTAAVATADTEAARVAHELQYLEGNQEAKLAAMIMQRGWRHFKDVQKNGSSWPRIAAHRISQSVLFRQLFFAMKARQIDTNTLNDGRVAGPAVSFDFATSA